MSFIQGLETINTIPYVGKTVTLSFYARAGANFSPTSSGLTVFILSSFYVGLAFLPIYLPIIANSFV